MNSERTILLSESRVNVSPLPVTLMIYVVESVEKNTQGPLARGYLRIIDTFTNHDKKVLRRRDTDSFNSGTGDS